jgi:hypothetical protein
MELGDVPRTQTPVLQTSTLNVNIHCSLTFLSIVLLIFIKNNIII